MTKALIRLRGCAGWSAPVLFPNPKDRFTCVTAQIIFFSFFFLGGGGGGGRGRILFNDSLPLIQTTDNSEIKPLNPNDNQIRQHNVMYTYWPLEVCNKRVTRVEVAGTRQLLASKAYLNSSSQTTCSVKTKKY